MSHQSHFLMCAMVIKYTIEEVIVTHLSHIIPSHNLPRIYHKCGYHQSIMTIMIIAMKYPVTIMKITMKYPATIMKVAMRYPVTIMKIVMKHPATIMKVAMKYPVTIMKIVMKYPGMIMKIASGIQMKIVMKYPGGNDYDNIRECYDKAISH